ncbi:twin-arginine translocation signal domain-containing protein [Bradyrhizobium sp. PMVTL-01]|uniref:twin-arginine translocation signal domain-containing protein n=1 Tax=Bradyrhizobium sp. PMVTL-01 TaxID=3434999 RepID=UPI003F6EB5E1
MTTRRTFLKAGGAIAAAAITPLPASSAEPTLVIGEAAATAVSPYAEYPWMWWVSLDGETFISEFETKEEALKEALGYGEPAMVAECIQQDFSLDVYGSEVLEMLQMNNEELIGEGEFLDCTSEESDDLGKMVTATIEAWAAKHKINLTAWTFGATRNRTAINGVVERDGSLGRAPITGEASA